MEINELSKQETIVNLCNRWANRSLAINQMVKNNQGNAYFIWQVMIGDYKNLKPNDGILPSKTKKAFDEIFIQYKSTRKLCQKSFGSNNLQLLLKIQIPMAIPTIMAGINQTVMMALAMSTIAAMVGAGGLGTEVLRAMGQLREGEAVIAGFAIVILAIIIDRISQGYIDKRTI